MQAYRPCRSTRRVHLASGGTVKRTRLAVVGNATANGVPLTVQPVKRCTPASQTGRVFQGRTQFNQGEDGRVRSRGRLERRAERATAPGARSTSASRR